MIKSMVDTHAHYVHKRFDSGREEILRELVDEGVIAVIEGAIDFASNQKMKLLCDKYSNVFMAAGCHPNCVEEMDEEKYQEIVELVNAIKCLLWEKLDWTIQEIKVKSKYVCRKNGLRNLLHWQ